MDDKCGKSKLPFICSEILSQENDSIIQWFFPDNLERSRREVDFYEEEEQVRFGRQSTNDNKWIDEDIQEPEEQIQEKEEGNERRWTVDSE